MKKRLLSILAILVLSLTAVPSVVLAVDGDTNGTEQTTTTSTTDKTAAEKKAAELQARLEKRKADLKTRLTTFQKNRLRTRCKAAQSLLAKVEGRMQTVQTKRGKVYTNITTRLSELSTKLKNKNIDTTELDAAITTLKGKVTTYTNDFTTYQQAVSDLTAMDCQSDPDGFKASLEAARAALVTVNTDAADIRTYLKDTIKPLLKTIRAQLVDTSQEGEE